MIDVRVFTRDGVEKDSRALAIQKAEIEKVRKDLNDQLRIVENDANDAEVTGDPETDAGPAGEENNS